MSIEIFHTNTETNLQIYFTMSAIINIGIVFLRYQINESSLQDGFFDIYYKNIALYSINNFSWKRSTSQEINEATIREIFDTYSTYSNITRISIWQINSTTSLHERQLSYVKGKGFVRDNLTLFSGTLLCHHNFIRHVLGFLHAYLSLFRISRRNNELILRLPIRSKLVVKGLVSARLNSLTFFDLLKDYIFLATMAHLSELLLDQ
jgi:hypothetical protein